MKEKEKELIRNHRYFIKEDENNFYLKKDKCNLIIMFREGIQESFPILWRNETDDEITLWEMEKWFRELYIKVNELYFKKNKIRMLSQNMKRSVTNIIYFTCLEEEKREQFESVWDMITNKKALDRKEYSSLVNKIKEKLENERYEVSLMEENEKILLTINE